MFGAVSSALSLGFVCQGEFHLAGVLSLGSMSYLGSGCSCPEWLVSWSVGFLGLSCRVVSFSKLGV